MPPAAEEVLDRLRNCVAERIGLCIRAEDGDAFRRILDERLKSLKFAALSAYLDFLTSDGPASAAEWNTLAVLLTTGESYFFRDRGQFSLLRHTVLPELLKMRREQRSLRIWSAGCATGEEPYSIAILLDQLIPDRRGWEVLIIGSDINPWAVRKAEDGIYTPWSFRMVDAGIKSNYFSDRKGEWQIAEKIKKMVTFRCGNLLDAGFLSRNPDISALDLIICRNVFIYFQRAAVAAVFAYFANLLNESGYLITGHGELQGHDLTTLRQLLYPEGVIYRKAPAAQCQLPALPLEPPRPKTKATPPARLTPIRPPAASVRTGSGAPLANPQTEIVALINTGRHAEALARAKNNLPAGPARHDMLCQVANALANSGDYPQAESACLEAISSNTDSAEPYFLLAHIAEARGDDQAAKGLLKKAIYLNPSLVAAYCELGELYAKENDSLRAGKSRAAAIELLMGLPPLDPVAHYGISAGELLHYLKGLADPGAAGPAALPPARNGRP